jgi:hypothetical protein
MANDAFRRSGRAFIEAKMNARSRPDVVADFGADSVRAVVDHAAFKNPGPVEHGKGQRQAVRVSGNSPSFLRWANLWQPIHSIGEKISGDHGASPCFKKIQGSSPGCGCPPFAFAKDMPRRSRIALKGILDMITVG